MHNGEAIDLCLECSGMILNQPDGSYACVICGEPGVILPDEKTEEAETFTAKDMQSFIDNN